MTGAAGHLADDQQAAAGLRVGEQQQLVLVDAWTSRCGRTQSRLRRVPPLMNPSAQRLARAVEVGHRGGVDDGGHAATRAPSCTGARAGRTRSRRWPPRRRRPARPGSPSSLSATIDVDGLREDLAGRLVPVVEHADAERLGQA